MLYQPEDAIIVMVKYVADKLSQVDYSRLKSHIITKIIYLIYLVKM